MPTPKKATKKPIKKEFVKETIQETCCKEEMKKNLFKHHSKSSSGGFYFLGFVGAAIYFIGQATTFRMGVVAFLKAIIRPVFLVHGLLKFLGL